MALRLFAAAVELESYCATKLLRSGAATYIIPGTAYVSLVADASIEGFMGMIRRVQMLYELGMQRAVHSRNGWTYGDSSSGDCGVQLTAHYSLPEGHSIATLYELMHDSLCQPVLAPALTESIEGARLVTNALTMSKLYRVLMSNQENGASELNICGVSSWERIYRY